MKEARKRYQIYEYIRDNDKITTEMSNTKDLIFKLIQRDEKIEQYCKNKVIEEKREIEEAMVGNHFHKNMTKREILINEISQYIYWLTIIAVSRYVKFEEFKEIEKINEILEKVDIAQIQEEKKITAKEIMIHDLEQMKEKMYLKGVI